MRLVAVAGLAAVFAAAGADAARVWADDAEAAVASTPAGNGDGRHRGAGVHGLYVGCDGEAHNAERAIKGPQERLDSDGATMLVGLGVQKGGSTSLYATLADAARRGASLRELTLCEPRRKEINFWDNASFRQRAPSREELRDYADFWHSSAIRSAKHVLNDRIVEQEIDAKESPQTGEGGAEHDVASPREEVASLVHTLHRRRSSLEAPRGRERIDLGPRAAAAPCNELCDSRIREQADAPVRFEISPRYITTPWTAKAMCEATRPLPHWGAQSASNDTSVVAPSSSHAPSAQLLLFALLREPVARAWSQFEMEAIPWQEQCAMEETLKACSEDGTAPAAEDAAGLRKLWHAVAAHVRERRPAIEAMLADGPGHASFVNRTAAAADGRGNVKKEGECMPRLCTLTPPQLFHRAVHREMQVMDSCYFDTETAAPATAAIRENLGQDVHAVGTCGANGMGALFDRRFRECAVRILADSVPPAANPWAFEHGGLYGSGGDDSGGNVDAKRGSTLAHYHGILADEHHGVLSVGMLARGLYAEQLCPFLHFHRAEDMFVMRSEHAYRDEKAAARRLLAWALHRAQAVPTRAAAAAAAERALPPGRSDSDHHVSRHLEVSWTYDEHTAGILRAWFAPHNARLDELLATQRIEGFERSGDSETHW